MCKIFGYGEDALTLWALKCHISKVLEEFRDQTAPSDCLVFFRPSFGRRGGKGSQIFGEFDAIIASSENVYLIESKWDNLSRFKDDEITLEEEQTLRHDILSWYITHWNTKYSNNWESLIRNQKNDFEKKFSGKEIAHSNRLLAANLEFVLNAMRKHCPKSKSENHIKNVLLFFYNATKSKPPKKVSKTFHLVKIDYGQEVSGNFIVLS